MVSILTAVQYIALFVLFMELTYIALKPPSKLQVTLTLLVVSTFFMMFGDLMEIRAQSLEAAWNGTVCAYIGKPMTILFAFLFMLEFFQYKLSDLQKMALVCYHAFYAVLVMCNDKLHLFYSEVGFNRSKLFSPLVLSHGVFYYIYMATILVYMAAFLFITIKELLRAKTKEYREQILWLMATPFSGILGLLIFLTGITKGYDTTMLGCFIGTLALGVLFLKFKLFDIVNYARERALNNTNNGLLVMNARNKIVYLNETADSIIKNGTTVEELLSRSKDDKPLNFRDKYYQTEVTELIRGGSYYGKSIDISDITDSYLYSDRLEKDVEERTRQLKNMQRSVIGGFAQIVELRDDTTGTHIQSTSRFVRMIVDELKKKAQYGDVIDESYAERITAAAPMHDIGKIAVSDTILLKPGKLTPEEYEAMKTHTTSGADIILRIMSGVESRDFIEMAVQMALGHHERWDGTGYPNGLRGEEIPLPARIMAVADVYDALISERPYKRAFTAEESLKIIRESSGTQFDPEIVDAFMTAISAEAQV